MPNFACATLVAQIMRWNLGPSLKVHCALCGSECVCDQNGTTTANPRTRIREFSRCLGGQPPRNLVKMGWEPKNGPPILHAKTNPLNWGASNPSPWGQMQPIFCFWSFGYQISASCFRRCNCMVKRALTKIPLFLGELAMDSKKRRKWF